ncbi:PHP domain-containing protein [Hahella ganghwensis]|uniref:PHP domain-containing protein n=1 Tax=Hahella ganghwensis TaxID=286420 RepID=UPI00035DBCA0|nr:PHP domain-containing protein [Hahella ganghwensis]
MQSILHNFDFHCHSTASDGSLTPQEMLELAVEAGLTQWSLTDHDTIEGYRQLCVGGPPDSLQLIPGVELTCDWHGITLHVLAFGFDSEAASLADFLKLQGQRREERAVRIAEKFEKKFKIEGVYEQACRISSSRLPARPHFARLMVELGLVSHQAEAFNKHLGAGKWGDVKLFWPQLEELMGAVSGAGGVSVIAHPFHYKMTATKLRRLLDEFQAFHGHGVEVGVPNTNAGQFGWLADELRKRKLYQSGGSDFHGKVTPWARLGKFPSLAKGVPSIQELLSAS